MANVWFKFSAMDVVAYLFVHIQFLPADNEDDVVVGVGSEHIGVGGHCCLQIGQCIMFSEIISPKKAPSLEKGPT